MVGSITIQNGVLLGEISIQKNLSGSIISTGELKGSLSRPIGYEDYVGLYEVKPSIESQTLQTSDKHLTNDITVKAIPYYSVDNNYNGQTVIIGGDEEWL